MKSFKVILIGVVILIVILAIGYGLGWFNVFATKTIGKAQENANRQVFEQTQSYVMGKRQQALKYYNEYIMTKDDQTKQIIKNEVSQMFAEFDDNKLNGESKRFVEWCKYGKSKYFN